uniref:RNA polymerase Rpb4/RPC9 core domain-containing protein n=1 Tax=Arcella intermedia TaxID=1963864 RepID=A0A6B2LR90_9EUKA
MDNPISKEDEDVSRLQLGPDFEGKEMLSISDVGLILQNQVPKYDPSQLTDVFNKTLEYTQRFSRLKNKATMQEANMLLKDTELHPFEQAQIKNLCPENVEEAQGLIPSLAGRDADMLLEVLENLSKLRKYH